MLCHVTSRLVTSYPSKNIFSYLIERVVFTLHVPVFDVNSQNVFVEGSGEVALQQLVIVSRFGDHMTHKLNDNKDGVKR